MKTLPLRPLEQFPNEPHFFVDRFSDERPMGKVIGSRTETGVRRGGVDVEGVIGIDNGALRIRPLLQPGWGRACIAYGPFQRENGLALATFILNGHNTSQTGPLPDSLPRRIYRWVRGSETESVIKRSYRWLHCGRNLLFWRQLIRWAMITFQYCRHQPEEIDENLAVGWFTQEAPTDLSKEGNTFVVYATGTENGELRALAGSHFLPIIRGLQNVPICYLVILREKGAAYYVASLPNVHGTAAYPQMRPVAIDSTQRSDTVFAGIQQSVLGQIGFRVDTRIYGVQVARLPEYSKWFGTAIIADRLTGRDSLHGSRPDVGGDWLVLEGRIQRTDHGVRGITAENLAVLNVEDGSGLVHAILKTGESALGSAAILWRMVDSDNYWQLEIDSKTYQLSLKIGGILENLVSGECSLKPNREYSIQILDDGETFGAYLDGKLLTGAQITDKRLSTATKLGFRISGASGHLWLRDFEAHPRQLAAPKLLKLANPWISYVQGAVIASDFLGDSAEANSFVGKEGAVDSARSSPVGEQCNGTRKDLAGSATTEGRMIWRREIGRGAIVRMAGCALVDASTQRPNPGRTAYTIEWNNPSYANLQVDITPPGTGRGQGERGRGGFIFWQDRSNYITISNWLDDCYGSASISSFFYLNGFEDLYDAVWTNVGERIYWGKAHLFRVVFDGLRFTAFINGEPVLCRSITDVYSRTPRLLIRRVGIVANWEWGNDTGTTFRNFIARDWGNGQCLNRFTV